MLAPVHAIALRPSLLRAEQDRLLRGSDVLLGRTREYFDTRRLRAALEDGQGGGPYMPDPSVAAALEQRRREARAHDAAIERAARINSELAGDADAGWDPWDRTPASEMLKLLSTVWYREACVARLERAAGAAAGDGAGVGGVAREAAADVQLRLAQLERCCRGT